MIPEIIYLTDSGGNIHQFETVSVLDEIAAEGFTILNKSEKPLATLLEQATKLEFFWAICDVLGVNYHTPREDVLKRMNELI